jgi:transketolase
MFAAHHKLDKLIVTVDWNGQQIDGPNDKVMTLGDLPGKWSTFGWDVIVEENGNDLESVIAVLEKAKERSGKGKPVVILLKTEMGYGVDYMVGTHKWHGKAPNQEQLDLALAQLPTTALGDF